MALGAGDEVAGRRAPDTVARNSPGRAVGIAASAGGAAANDSLGLSVFARSPGRNERSRGVLDLGFAAPGALRRYLDLALCVRGWGVGPPALAEHSGHQEGVGVHLSALGFCDLLGVSGAGLAKRCVDLSEILGRDADKLACRVGAAASPDRKVAVLQTALAGRVRDSPGLAPGLIWAFRTLSASPSVRVGELAFEVGWSRKRLASRLSTQVGLSPRRFSEVVRVDKAGTVLGTGNPSLAEVAVRADHYDEAHLDRYVRAFAGTTPAVWAAELVSGGPADA